jgi:hypothetical protein
VASSNHTRPHKHQNVHKRLVTRFSASQHSTCTTYVLSAPSSNAFVFYIAVPRLSVRVRASMRLPLRSNMNTPTKGVRVPLSWPEHQISCQTRHRPNKCYTAHCLMRSGSKYRGPGWNLSDLFEAYYCSRRQSAISSPLHPAPKFFSAFTLATRKQRKLHSLNYASPH